ncbi:putative glutamine amidotransferase [Tumebacillus permanentifrigoris]|uniref:Putative glutamine amidotransferase n=2 Tax=Tumebacillus permanentifrigoris TaxID=378543 RepID=A0A316DAE7_9BACL|nr:putative glutamine amidotransferase [Tumebacillus permanentifrigoris]
MYPWVLLALLPAGYAVYRWYRDERRLHGARKKTVAILRSLLFLSLTLAVAGTAWLAPVTQQAAVFVIDESKSIDSPREAVSFLRTAVESKQADDGYAVVGLGERPAVEYPLTQAVRTNLELSGVSNPNYTNLASGLRLAEGLVQPGYRPRVILLSDGEQNAGDAVAEAAFLKQRGVLVDVAALKRDVGREVLIRSASTPTTLYEGESFSLKTTLESTVDTTAELNIYEDNSLVSTQSVSLQKGDNSFALPLKSEQPGFHRYRVEVQSADDTVAANNTAFSFGEVAGRPAMLVLEGQPGDAKWLTSALQASGLAYEVKPGRTAPDRLEDLRRYAAIVLANVSGVDLPEQVQQQIEIAVRDFGVGLMMTGGQDAFGLGGYFGTPVEKALPVYMDIRSQKEIPSLGLMLVIDHSGSMQGQKMELAKEAARRAAQMLTPQDTLGVLAFDSSPYWVVEPKHVNDVKDIQNQVSSIQASGGTDIYPALVAAFDRMKTVQAKRKHIILLTDGQAPNGDYDGLTKRMRDQNVTMSTVAVGQDADQNLLRGLAEKAKGRFYNTTDSQNVPQIFSKETALAGKTYIQDAPFTPAIGVAADLAPLFAGGLPQINAQIATTAKETADTMLANPSGEPLLVRWQYGLGRAVAWTSDAKGVWSNQWAAWEGSSAFWNQLMTWLLPQYHAGDLDVRSGISGAQGQVEVQVKQPLASGAVLKAKVIGTDLSEQEVPLLLQAPGRYTGNFSSATPGTYMVTVNEQAGDVVLHTSTTGVSVPYSPEYSLPKNGLDTLQRIAEAGGGEVLESAEDVFRDNLPSKWQYRDLSLWFLLVAALLWPFDTALRRVSITWKWKLWKRPQTAGAAASVPAISSLVAKVRERKRGSGAEPRETRVGTPQSSAIAPTNSTTTTPPPPQTSPPDSETISKLLAKKRRK